MLSDALVELFSLIVIGHIHTPFEYKQNNTLVISPGSMIDYQAYTDRTGPVILDTETMEYKRIPIITPHIVKVNCSPKNINDILSNVTQNIYHITYDGDTDAIDNDLFIKAKNIAVNLVIDVVQHEEEKESIKSKSALNIYEWVQKNYPDYIDIFSKAKEAIC